MLLLLIKPTLLYRDLDIVNKCLTANRLVVNFNKTVQLVVGSSASSMSFKLGGNSVKTEPVCKYLGIFLAAKLSFQLHVDFTSTYCLSLRYHQPAAIIVKRIWIIYFTLTKINRHYKTVSPLFQGPLLKNLEEISIVQMYNVSNCATYFV